MATKYTVIADDVTTDFTRSKKDTAVEHARELLKTKAAAKVQVTTDAGTVVFEAARRNVTKHTKPYTLVVELPEELQDLVPEGYAPAYARLRNQAVVLRREVDIEEDEARYSVINTVTRAIAGFAPTTRAAGAIMKAMGAEVRAAKANA